MSKHYSANQYEIPFKASYLRNWEVPKYYCPNPRPKKGVTTIIANPRGHLIPGIPRPKCQPFGEYVGTWGLPIRITREVANQLNGSAYWAHLKAKCRKYGQEFQRVNKLVNIDEISEDKEDVALVLCPIHGYARASLE